ncbi:MAG: patatin-like phospholipase family protein [Coprobacillaceae bacterium]
MKIALVLAGGGAKGAYQSGSIKALQELGYHFDIVTGTSIGALNGLLVVQQDYQALYQLWDQISVKDVMKYPINFDFSIDSLLKQSNLLTSFFKSYINQKGADISPLINLINSLAKPDIAYSSPIDYGLVVVEYPSLNPKQVRKKDMQEDNIVDYAIASASCFPAFPIYHIDKQGYIDGGYYDNLPISLAMEMGADHIITIELQPGAIHEYFLNRPSITRIRPSRDLGGFLDFNRDVLDQRIKQGYFDTLKIFKKYKGFTYTFSDTEVPLSQQTYFYNTLLRIEDKMNHISPRVILEDVTPLSDYLLSMTYESKLLLEDYLLLALETTLDIYQYPFDILYNYEDISTTIFHDFMKEYQDYVFEKNTRAISLKKLTNLLKEVTVKESIYYLYHALETKEKIDKAYIANVFPKPYLVALYLYTISKTKEV